MLPVIGATAFHVTVIVPSAFAVATTFVGVAMPTGIGSTTMLFTAALAYCAHAPPVSPISAIITTLYVPSPREANS
jgi:hypothetical protein